MRKLVLTFAIPLLIAFFSFNYALAQNASGLSVGDMASDFELKSVSGEMVSMANFADAKGIILVFTCNHCPYSKLYEDRINALDKKYASQGYPVIAINPNDPEVNPSDSFEGMIERSKEKGFTFPYLVDETQEIAKLYGATRTPHTFVLKKESGDFFVKYIGAIDDNPKEADAAKTHYIEDAVEAVLKGKTVETTKTKAIGCSIKWKNS